jgi:hypothetical protein
VGKYKLSPEERKEQTLAGWLEYFWYISTRAKTEKANLRQIINEQ